MKVWSFAEVGEQGFKNHRQMAFVSGTGIKIGLRCEGFPGCKPTVPRTCCNPRKEASQNGSLGP